MLTRRLLATLTPEAAIARPPPSHPPSRIIDDIVRRHFLYSSCSSTESPTSLTSLVDEYVSHSDKVLNWTLPYESRPGNIRRCEFDASTEHTRTNGLVLVAHFVGDEEDYAISVSSGFALSVDRGDTDKPQTSQSVIVTCAHTLEEMRRSRLFTSVSSSSSTSPSLRSGTLILSRSSPDRSLTCHSASHVISSLHRSDLLLLTTDTSGTDPSSPLNSLPVSPYPAHPGTSVRAHFVTDREPQEKQSGWSPWIEGTWSKWVRGKVLGYRDFAGREAQPGTYDALSHMLFEPSPMPGSSGGPIVDEESGAVVGVMLGSRMDNRMEGLRGWGVPSEAIYEMFSLPGLNLNRS